MVSKEEHAHRGVMRGNNLVRDSTCALVLSGWVSSATVMLDCSRKEKGPSPSMATYDDRPRWEWAKMVTYDDG